MRALEAIAAADGGAGVDILKLLAEIPLSRPDAETPIEVLIIGDPIQTVAGEPHFSMRDDEGGFRLPSDAHIRASLAETPYGTAGREAALAAVTVHLCRVPDGEAWASDADEALNRFWSLFIAHQGGQLATWTDDLATCLDRFVERARKGAKAFVLDESEEGLVMKTVSRAKVATEDGTATLGGIEVESFNLFSTRAHPMLPGVEVVTGIKYDPRHYPRRYDHAWCYFVRYRNGVPVRFDIGARSYGQSVRWRSAQVRAQRTAGIAASDVLAAREACQLPDGSASGG
ncbi:MAG: hypothetical protein AAF416_22540 [Pseudomonadota bacterium]